jgi:flavorubredoxin
MAGGLKDFFDRILGDARGKVNEKPYVAFSSAGVGGKEAIESIDRICTVFKMKRIGEGVVATGKPTSEVLAECQELGKKLAMTKAS